MWVLAAALTMLCALSQPLLAQGAIEGEIRYYAGGAAVPGVSVGLTGVGQTTAITDSDGLYAFSDPGAGSCSIEPSKNGGVNNAISALDATWVLQAVVGSRQFDATQLLACDVTGDGTISALDAARILQVLAGVRSRFPVAEACGSDWLFVPAPGPAPDQHIVSPQMSPQCSPGEIIYGSLSEPVTAQDFIAAVFGDCTGNWAAATPPANTPTPQGTVPPTQTPPPPTVSNTPTATATPALPATATATATVSATRSLTATASRTSTSTRTMTASASPTSTVPPVATASSTRTPTPVPPATASATATFSRTSTVSQTPTNTRTQTRTPTVSSTATFSRSATATQTPSSTRTPTRTVTITRTMTATNTVTVSPTPSQTITRTPSRTGTPTLTATGTFTATATPTATCVGGLSWEVSAPLPISSQSGGMLWLAKTVPTNTGWGIFWLRTDPNATNFARLYYAHVDFNNQITVPPTLVISIPKTPFRGHYYFAAWNADHYGLLISNQASVLYYNMSMTGALTGQRTVGPALLFGTEWDQESDGDLDAYPDGFLGVIEGECGGGHSCSYAFKLDRFGNPVGSPINLVDFDFTHQFYPHAAFDNAGWAIISVKDITISGGGVMTKYLPLSGSISSNAKVVPAKEYLWDEFPDIAWNGNHFASIWTENSARSDTVPWQIHFASFRRTKTSSTLISERVLDMVAQKTNHRWTTQMHAVNGEWVAQYATRAADGSINAVYELLGDDAQTHAAREPFPLTADALGSSPHFAAGHVGEMGIARGSNSTQGSDVTFYTLPPAACR
jgi:hypothetical protein